MTAKLAEFRNTQRRARYRVSVVSRPCNDNHPLPRRHKPALIRRWHTTAAGKLECTWHVEMATSWSG